MNVLNLMGLGNKKLDHNSLTGKTTTELIDLLFRVNHKVINSFSITLIKNFKDIEKVLYNKAIDASDESTISDIVYLLSEYLNEYQKIKTALKSLLFPDETIYNLIEGVANIPRGHITTVNHKLKETLLILDKYKHSDFKFTDADFSKIKSALEFAISSGDEIVEILTDLNAHISAKYLKKAA